LLAVNDYALELTEGELARYRMMAENAASDEAAWWASAGIVPGATVADVGCGPGATLAVLAATVGEQGHAAGVDADPGAIEYAKAAIADMPQATATVGDATASGLPTGEFDVVMCRHVLAHNGGREQAIVDHLASLARPGGSVYLLDVDLRAFKLWPPDLDDDMSDRYADFHAGRGNDPSIGLRLGSLLEAAGLTIERYNQVGRMLRPPVGLRPPSWVAREAMVAEGHATAADLARWEAMLTRIDNAEPRPWMAIPSFVAVGRKA
jgi:SAM-dependent methyltransferase